MIVRVTKQVFRLIRRGGCYKSEDRIYLYRRWLFCHIIGLYGKRWTVETVFSVIKRRFGDRIKSRSDYSKFIESSIIPTTYNIWRFLLPLTSLSLLPLLNPLFSTEQVGVIKFAMKKPDKYWSDSENNTIVSNGTVMWIYDKKNEVTKIKLPHVKRPKFDYGKLIEEMLKGNDVKMLGSEKADGKDCYVMEVIPKNRTFYSKTLHITSKLWIDKEYRYPLKIELNYGKFSITIEYRNVKFNTAESAKTG